MCFSYIEKSITFTTIRLITNMDPANHKMFYITVTTHFLDLEQKR